MGGIGERLFIALFYQKSSIVQLSCSINMSYVGIDVRGTMIGIITTEFYKLNVAHGIVPKPDADAHCSHHSSNERIYIISIGELFLLQHEPAEMLVAQSHHLRDTFADGEDRTPVWLHSARIRRKNNA
jgi:hypothetical protein